jgi:predicted nucleotidyltransferase
MVEKNNTQRVLRHFFTYPTESIHLRELSRQLKLSMPAILAAVKKLAKEQLIIMKKTIALTTVEANSESVQFVRLKRVDNLERMLTCGLVDTLVDSYNQPQAIVLFGSYARGEDTEESDIDVVVVASKEIPMKLERFERLLKRRISLHTIVLEKVSEEFRSNLCNGIVLEGAL